MKTSSGEDDDVAAERERVHSDENNASGDILRMVDLVKVSGTGRDDFIGKYSLFSIGLWMEIWKEIHSC